MSLYKIIIFLLLVGSILTLSKQEGPTNNTINKAYGKKEDSIGTLLDRIEWTMYRPIYISIISRYILMAIVLTFVASIVLLGSLPPARIYLLTVIVILTFSLVFNSYFTWHADKFSSYTVISNIKNTKKNVKSKKKSI